MGKGKTMSIGRDEVLAVLAKVTVPGGTLVSRDLVRALMVDGSQIRFVIEAATPEEARALAPAQIAAELALKALPGVTSVQAVMTAHGPAPKAATAAPPTPASATPAATNIPASFMIPSRESVAY